MSGADLVVFAPDWHTARGCRIEHLVCELYGIPTLVAPELTQRESDPCRGCEHAPPSSFGGKPCSVCEPSDPLLSCKSMIREET